MKKLLTLLAAFILAGCELIDTTSTEPQQIEKQKVYIYTNTRPYPWTMGIGQDFQNVRCDIAIDSVGTYQVYLSPRPSCGEVGSDFVVIDLEPGTYTGKLQHFVGYGYNYNLTQGIFDFEFTVTLDGDCLILDSGKWNRWN